ncbi:hypothetical protein [Streptomyces sp. UNOB3_S3]|uniref:hypothetical protein n=1 Tax=Streptomyces sp. UNOB3_S3 TaxID=2871682 RepID=UPI001E58FC59|nr:hypothetical protein [Streptomyces sp. UNOB3_S3]MCC3774960.1 hypothetical protein [Streptomyces sp. UNOB3_S3]
MATVFFAAASLIAVGCFFALGGYTRWQDARSLDRACGGILPKGDIESLMGSDRLYGGTPLIPRTKSLQSCSITSRGHTRGTTGVSIDWRGEEGGAFLNIGQSGLVGDYTSTAPIGNGWSGVMTWSKPIGYASVIAECRGANKDLMVSVSSYPAQREDAFNTPQGFGDLARVATKTMERAAKKWGCDANMGRPVTSVTPPSAYKHDRIPVDQARGTCRPVAGTKLDTKGSGPAKAIETPTDNALIEDCYLLDGKGRALYHLSAYYGPYALELRESRGALLRSPAGSNRDTGSAWARSECRNFFGTARFTVTLERDALGSDTGRQPDPDLPAKLLTSFAKNAAERHGCSNVALPSTSSGDGTD